MNLDLWVVVECPCGGVWALPEGGRFPVCGSCGWPACAPTDMEERKREASALLALEEGPEQAVLAAGLALGRAGGGDGLSPRITRSGRMLRHETEDVKRWALERGWDPEARSWGPPEGAEL